MRTRKKEKIENRKVKALALSQISLLVVEIFAFAFLFSLSLGIVSAASLSSGQYSVSNGVVYTVGHIDEANYKLGTTSLSGRWLSVGNDKITDFTEITSSPSSTATTTAQTTTPSSTTSITETVEINGVEMSRDTKTGIATDSAGNQYYQQGGSWKMVPTSTTPAPPSPALNFGARISPQVTSTSQLSKSVDFVLADGKTTVSSKMVQYSSDDSIQALDANGKVLGTLSDTAKNKFNALLANGDITDEDIFNQGGSWFYKVPDVVKINGQDEFISLNVNNPKEGIGYSDNKKYTENANGAWSAIAGSEATPSTWGKSRTFNLPFGLGKESMNPLAGNLLEGITWATGIWGALQAAKAIGIIPEKYNSLESGLASGAFAGIMTYKTLTGIAEVAGVKERYDLGRGVFINTKYVAMGTGLLVGYLVLANAYTKKDTKEQKIEFKCMAWQAPRGGSDCTKCNSDPLKPCSEYRCRSLGQTCKLINAGTGLDKCIDGSRDDVTSPGIKPDPSVLTQGYKYSEVKNRPPGGTGPAGMKVVGEDNGCLQAFKPFEFGILTTDTGDVAQEAQCKIDFNHTTKMDDMQYWMGDVNLFLENHSQTISLPGTKALNDAFPEIQNDGEYTLYIRCRDGNGNENRDEFAVRFCIDKSPDLTAPLIKAFSIPSGSPVLYKIDNLSIDVYTNEPSNCKWDRKDADYNNMQNQMQCSNALYEMNAENLYTCTTTLTGIKDKEDNNFFFRCQDMNNNTMQEGYPYTLIGTQPLTILSVGPTGTVGGNTNTVTTQLEVHTDNGYKNGEATCAYSTTSDSGYIDMFETGTNVHKQSLDLVNGNYRYYFTCVDAGGNAASNSTNFTVFVDKYAPLVVRAYSLESKLVVITDENSSCSYSTSSCNFDLSKNEGTSMPYQDSTQHYAEWKTNQNYYVKCSDKYNNQPEPSECSIVLRPYEIQSS